MSTPADGSVVLTLFGTRTGTAIEPPAGGTERWDVASTGGQAASRTTSQASDEARPQAGPSGPRTATAAVPVNGVARSVAVAPATRVTTVRYGHSGPRDTPSRTMGGDGAVTERTHALLGGAVLTRRAGGDVWGYPNLHGDVMATADASGAKTGPTRA